MPSPKEEVESLMNDLLPFAKYMIEKEGEFYPFGGFMDPSGKMVHVGVKMDTEYPSGKRVFEVLKEYFRDLALSGKCRATGIVADVSITPPGRKEPGDAIRISLEHKDGYAAHVFYPYALVEGEVNYFDPFAIKGDFGIFSRGKDD